MMTSASATLRCTQTATPKAGGSFVDVVLALLDIVTVNLDSAGNHLAAKLALDCIRREHRHFAAADYDYRRGTRFTAPTARDNLRGGSARN